MNSPNSNPSPRRRRNPMACLNCRDRKLKCIPIGPAENSPCERCVKHKAHCEYRPVDQGSASNNNYPDNPITLTPPYPSLDQFPANQFPQTAENWPQPPINSHYPHQPAPFNPYSVPSYPPSSYQAYPTPQQGYSSFPAAYSTGQHYSQFVTSPNPPNPSATPFYQPTPGPYDQSVYTPYNSSNNHYGNQPDNSRQSRQ